MRVQRGMTYQELVDYVGFRPIRHEPLSDTSYEVACYRIHTHTDKQTVGGGHGMVWTGNSQIPTMVPRATTTYYTPISQWYFFLFDHGRLTYWGLFHEFHRQEDPDIREAGLMIPEIFDKQKEG